MICSFTSRRPLLSSRLRRGHAVHAPRADLELCSGAWSTEPVLVEDGRATRLLSLPEEGSLLLTRSGELLVVRPSGRAGLLRARLFVGTPDVLWASVCAHEPAAVPGRGELPRYWVLREPLSPTHSLYGVYDLQEMRVVERGMERAEADARVARINAHDRARGSVDRHSDSRPASPPRRAREDLFGWSGQKVRTETGE